MHELRDLDLMAASRRWRMFTVFAPAAFVSAFVVLPGSGARDLASAVAGLAAAGAVLVGVDRFAPERRLAWLLLVWAFGFAAAGNVVFFVVVLSGGQGSGFPPAAAACFMLTWVFQGAAVALMVHRRRGLRLARVIELVAVALAALLATGVLMVAPHVRASATSGPAWLFGLMYLTVAAALVWAVDRYLAVPAPGPVAARCMLAGVVLLTAGAVAILVLTGAGAVAPPWWLVGVFPVANLVLASAALHPSMVELTSPIPVSDSPSEPMPFRAFGLVFLVVPVLVAFSGEADRTVVVAGVLVLEALALARLVIAVRDKEAELIERTLLEDRYRSVVGSLVEGVLVCDVGGSVLEANPAASVILGADRTALVDPEFKAPWRALAPDGSVIRDEGARIWEAVGLSDRWNGDLAGETRRVVGLATDTTKTRWIEVCAVGVQARIDTTSTTVISFRDVSDRVEAEENLRRLATAERLARESEFERQATASESQAKSEFLSRMSHELRTPLHAVIGFAQVLQQRGLSPADKTAVDHIAVAGRHLLGLIDEVLETARIESGDLIEDTGALPVIALVESTIALVAPQARSQGSPVTLRSQVSLDAAVQASEKRLVQVILNLLSNALKYGGPGTHVSVTVSSQEPAGPSRTALSDPSSLAIGSRRGQVGPQTRISVHNTGSSLTPEQIAKLFVPFERLGAELTGIEGTGIGLALSARLIETIGGQIGAEADADDGMTFWIQLRTAQAQHEHQQLPHPRPNANGHPRSVLYIDDNQMSLELFARMLEGDEDLSVLTASTGMEGLELARIHRPDLVLLDLHLPDIDGSAVLRALRSNDETSQIPVVIASADAQPSTEARLMSQGAAAYLTKPIDLAHLLDTVEQVSSPRRTR